MIVGIKVAEIVEYMHKKGLTSGKSHLSFGAAAVYIVSNMMDINKTQNEIAKALHISDMVIRKRYKEILVHDRI